MCAGNAKETYLEVLCFRQFYRHFVESLKAVLEATSKKWGSTDILFEILILEMKTIGNGIIDG